MLKALNEFKMANDRACVELKRAATAYKARFDTDVMWTGGVGSSSREKMVC